MHKFPWKKVLRLILPPTDHNAFENYPNFLYIVYISIDIAIVMCNTKRKLLVFTSIGHRKWRGGGRTNMMDDKNVDA